MTVVDAVCLGPMLKMEKLLDLRLTIVKKLLYEHVCEGGLIDNEFIQNIV
ncbi:hypothetical protein ES703_52814 [subsurface metagenome]